jgi:hypothetical protein
MATDHFQRAVVKSVALSCLLTLDFVSKSRPPPIKEMVANELPRVLGVLDPDVISLAGLRLDGPATDPADLLAQVTDRLIVAKKVWPGADIVEKQGHVDPVFSAVHFYRKPPTATERRIQDYTMGVARVLNVAIDDAFDDDVGQAYDAAHTMLVRAPTERAPTERV